MYLFLKRLFDILFSLIGIIILVPATIFIKIAYVLSGDFSSIFYHQIRIGKDGKEFKLFKFRTMIKNADEVLAKLIKDPKYKAEWEEYHKLENDPRITKIGKFIRHGSIDEIPQFLNILGGKLSLIGPRPLVPGEIEEYHGNKKLYESVKPGITGWWAVNGRSATNTKKRLELEYYYIKNRSLGLDTKIFFKTIVAIFKRDGAK